RSNATVNETLTVLCNGQPPDIGTDDYQTWINDLVPPGLTSLCFFDAERLDTFSGAEQQNGLMGEALRRLLGLDLVERLQVDLEIKKTISQIEELSGDLLPFCLVPELCQKLGRRLIEEAKGKLRQTTEDLWQERVSSFRQALRKDEIWKGLRLSAQSRAILIE